jgi:hypothetical protein
MHTARNSAAQHDSGLRTPQPLVAQASSKFMLTLVGADFSLALMCAG